MKRSAGFSFIEVMIGMVIVAIVVISALQFTVYCQRFTINSDRSLIAANLAQETMESKYWSAINGPSSGSGGANTTYNITADDINNPSYYIITVTTSWNS